VILAILFTTGQLRSTFSLSKQEWRSYRRALAPLNPENNHSPCFGAGHLLATGVVRRACGALAAPVSAFSALAEGLFAVCSAHPWPLLERSYLLLDLPSAAVELVDPEGRYRQIDLGILIRLSPLIAEIREKVVVAGPGQRDLAFPPMVAGARQ
jgi:hypothetical protein